MRILNKELKNQLPSDVYKYKTVIVMDNATVHKAKLCSKSHEELKLKVFFTPPYSPE
jgi:transposase